MAPLQIPSNFKFKPLFLVSSPLEDEGSPSFAQPTIVSSTNISPSQVAFNSTCEDLSNQIPPKKWKLYESQRRFKMLGQPICLGQNFSLMKKGWCNKLDAKFAQMLKGRKHC